ncbi:MAG: PEP-CTERM sorting domain-containing protein, partial [Okeania sp. SIO4D6]|nr:PEP-CTERM sorting domain-containing protein [Okeania sp. SIO4D6]
MLWFISRRFCQGLWRKFQCFCRNAEGSHEGLYNFEITSAGGILSESVPEPSSLLGLMTIGGLVA